ncbi:hypothetical protein FZEAL_9802 [Fusarium zealandicum]|uniref:Uncharacterized protein n=1 Tax=Fusarium zealandicum TaxID=1053134 RepID=A0A8H4U807_9HYPO|nr:hypothetical protein FZEAL_9802 [Fusarium zealandicum]
MTAANNIRICCSFSWRAHSPTTSSKTVLFRRISMILNLFFRAFLSIVGIFRHPYGTVLLSVIVGTILTILNFFFIGWCLGKTGEAEGQRRMFGKLVRSLHFDIFLYVCLVIHIIFFVYAFVAWDGLGGAGLSGTWLAMWLLVFTVAWIAT